MEVLSLPGLVHGVFVSRPNRFTAVVRVGEKKALAHVHDPGRLRELLVPGAKVLLLPRKGRRTDYHIIAVWRESYGWVFIHSGYHRAIVERLIEARTLPEFKGLRGYASEVPLEGHRIDFALVYDSGIVLMETKGCTLFKGNRAYFPDAPTERGRLHVEILSKNQPSMLIFLVMTDRVDYLMPNWDTDHAFGEALKRALLSGVHATALTFSFDGRALHYKERIPILFSHDAKDTAKEAEDAVREFNERFGPELMTTLSVAAEKDVWIMFYGFACVSCGLSDYFEDFAEMLGARLIGFQRVGAVYIARFSRGWRLARGYTLDSRIEE